MDTDWGAPTAGTPPETPLEILRQCVRVVRNRLPPGWSATSLTADAASGYYEADTVVRITSPAGGWVDLLVEVKRVLERRDVARAASQVETRPAHIAKALGVVAARYLAPPVREELAARGISFVDATGNLRLVVSQPGLYLGERGADRDPWRGPGRPRGTLKGAPAARVVRALVDEPRDDWSVRELIDVAKTSTGATYRVLEFLERQDLITREKDGRLRLRHWRPLLELWSKDYGFLRDNRITTYIEPRGLSALAERLAAAEGIRYAVTGTIAAAAWTEPYAPARAAMIYVEDAAAAQEAWGLRPTESGQNVLLAESDLGIAFERTATNTDGVEVVACSQVAVDLLTGPGRAPEEALELLDWMERNESTWRR